LTITFLMLDPADRITEENRKETVRTWSALRFRVSRER
jgi:hypothetical protein